MRGKYYLKHTINHTVDNMHRIKSLNENHKSAMKQNAIDFIKKPDISIDEKVKYLKGLTHDVYRYGTKYKYECNLTNVDISLIIKAVNDDKLHIAYFGKTIKEDDEQNVIISLILIGVIIFVFILFKACSS